MPGSFSVGPKPLGSWEMLLGDPPVGSTRPAGPPQKPFDKDGGTVRSLPAQGSKPNGPNRIGAQTVPSIPYREQYPGAYAVPYIYRNGPGTNQEKAAEKDIGVGVTPQGLQGALGPLGNQTRSSLVATFNKSGKKKSGKQKRIPKADNKSGTQTRETKAAENYPIP